MGNSLSVQFMKTELHLLPLGILLSLAGASFGQPVIATRPQSSTNVDGTSTRVIYHQSQQSSALRRIPARGARSETGKFPRQKRQLR